MDDRHSRVAAAIVSQWPQQRLHSLKQIRATATAVRLALQRRGMVPEPDERLFQVETALIRHHFMDQQHFQPSPILTGAYLLNVSRSREFVDAFLPQVVPETPSARVRLGFDSAGIRAGMQVAAGPSPGNHVFGFLYAGISHPFLQELQRTLTIAALDPPETHVRVALFVLLVKGIFAALGIPGYIHADHGFYKTWLRIADCPWCPCTHATVRLPVFNSCHEVILDDELPMVPGLLHFLCVSFSSLIKENDTQTVKDCVAKWSAFDFEAAFDTVSIKELTKLAEGEDVQGRELCALLPGPVADVIVSILDMRIFFKSRSAVDWEAMMGGIMQVSRSPSVGVHIGWHFPSISRQLFGGRWEPMIEQTIEHLNQEFIFLRRRHNLYATARLLQYRNAMYVEITTEQVLFILSSSAAAGDSALLTIRDGTVEELPREMLAERTQSNDVVEAPILSYLGGRQGPGGRLSIIVAVLRGSVVIGYLAALFGMQVYVFDFYVLEAYRNLGAGSLLLRRLLDSAASSRTVINRPSQRTLSILQNMALEVVPVAGGGDVEIVMTGGNGDRRGAGCDRGRRGSMRE